MRNEREIFQELGQVLVDCSPEQWSSWRLEARMYDDYGEVVCFVTTSGEPEHEFYPGGRVIDRLYVLLDELRMMMKTTGQEQWNRADMHLTQNGSFRAQFHYIDPT